MRESSVLLALALLLALGLPLSAQQNVGGITGVVTDASGGVIPSASVVAEHQATNQRREVATNSAGIYSFSLLQVGFYKLRVSTAGFKSFERADIPVVSGETISVNIQLDLGDVSETVTVEAEAPVLDTTSHNVGTTRTSDEIGRLPLTLAGNSSRSAAGFARTVAGVNFNPAESGGQDFMVISRSQINGSMAGTWGYQIDGVEGGMGEAESGSDFMSPIPETIEEFRLTANADASSGFNGGVTMQMTLKSGGNDFHGNVFWYNRNDNFAARNFFDRSGRASVENQNEIGFTFGGPIIKNKTFFFTSIDVYRFRTAATGSVATVPTARMRQGDFGELLTSEGRQIYDPLTTRPDGQGGFTRTAFPNNVIPADRISSISKTFQDGWALPTGPGTQLNWNGAARPTLVDKDQFYLKIDHNISDNHRFTFAYEAIVPWFLPEVSGESGHSFISGGNGFLAPEIVNGFIDDRDSERYRFNYMWTVSPNVLFDFRAGVTRNPNRLIAKYPFSGPAATFGRDAGLRGTLAETTPTTNVQGIGGFGPIFNQILVGSQKTPFTAAVSWFKGSHNLKFGADYIALPFTTISDFNSQGNFSFLDRETGLPGNPASGVGWASFLLGEVASATVVSPVDQRAYAGALAFYAQDQWRVNSKWTFSYGVRYNIFQPMRELQDKISTFDPTLPNPGAGGRLGALSIYGQGTGRNGLTNIADTYWKAWSPHLGIAYSLDPRTVIRASYGLTYTPYWQKWYGSTGPTQPTAGFSASLTAASLDNGVTPAFNWNNGFPLAFPQLPRTDPALQNGSSLGYIDRRDNRPPTSQNISFEIGRELPGQLSIRGAWVSNLSHRLPANGAVDLNAMPMSNLSLGNLLTADINSPEARAAGIPIPYDGFRGSVAQALRPYPQYLGVPSVNAQTGSASYHAFQLNVQKRMGDLAFLAAYTISKQLTSVNFPGFTGAGGTQTQHPDLRGLTKELLQKDKPHILNLSWAYDLPFGKGKKYMGGASKAMDNVLGGWRISAIQNYMSGEPIRVTSRNTLPGGFGSIWPVRVPDVPIEATGCGDYDPGNPSLNRYMNRAAFTNAAPFSVGNTSVLPSVRRCGFADESLQIDKRFAISERFNVRFGTMIMNLFNRHIFTTLGTDIDNPATFGVYSAASPPRNVQWFLRVEF